MLALTADQIWNTEIAHSSLRGRPGKFHFLSAPIVTPSLTSSHPMKPKSSESNQRDLSAQDTDLNQDCWPRISDVPKRIVQLWPYAFIFISVAGFVYIFAVAR